MKTVILALILGIGAPVLFGQRTTGMAIYGVGGMSCGELNRERDRTMQLAYVAWIGGFVSGIASAGNRALRETSIPEMTQWVERYCAANPQVFIWQAASGFVREINQSR